MRLGLLRHARTEWNAIGRLQGRADTALTAESRAEFSALVPPPPWDCVRLVSSELGRAVETARVIGSREPETDARLAELDVGRWTGRLSSDLRADPDEDFHDPAMWGEEYAPHGGENSGDVWLRVQPVLRELAMEGRDTLMVGHFLVMRVILARAHGWDLNGRAPFEIRRRRIYPVQLDADGMPHDPEPPIKLVPR